MLKNILKLDGVKVLSKSEQKGVTGGRCGDCDPEIACCHLCVQTGCFWHTCSGHCSPSYCTDTCV